jgi:hypothetical protein
VDAVIDVPGTWGELTQIAVIRRIVRTGVLVTNTAVVVADLLSDRRTP